MLNSAQANNTERAHQPLAAAATRDEIVPEKSLRPRTLSEYIGQTDHKKNLRIFIDAAKKRDEALEHILLYGPPGLGKTTLATILANEMNTNIITTSGPALEKAGDIAALLSNLKEKDVLFIDEIHRLKATIEEILYSAMEDYCLDIVVGKGPSARTMRLSLPKFTLVGATTKTAMLSAPLRDRFGDILRLKFYSVTEISHILKRSAHILNCDIDDEASTELARSARFTPRIANRLLRRARDFATVNNTNLITKDIVLNMLSSLGIDKFGLNYHDRELLRIIHNDFAGGPVGLNTLAAAISEEGNTIEDVYEPYLLKKGFIERTPRGRKITTKGMEYIATLSPQARN